MRSTPSRKKLLEKSRLYVILDKDTCGRSRLLPLARTIARCGRCIIQLRDKHSSMPCLLQDAARLRAMLRREAALLIINDYLDVARITGSDGVHLGQSDVSVEIARRILGKDKLIGVSCHNLRQALDAQARGADYIGFGPLFPTPTKPEYPPVGLDDLNVLRKKMKIPVFAIGNVNRDNIGSIVSAGAQRVAVCRDLIRAEDPAAAGAYFLKMLEHRPPV